MEAGPLAKYSHLPDDYFFFPKLEGEIGPRMRFNGKTVLNWSLNNYLGLANHPEVVDAAIEGIRKYGAGTASVRFICGTFDCHERLEDRIARFYGVEAAYTFTSCWNANEAIFPTLCEPGDIIISDELNHASRLQSLCLHCRPRCTAAHWKTALVVRVESASQLQHVIRRYIRPPLRRVLCQAFQ